MQTYSTAFTTRNDVISEPNIEYVKEVVYLTVSSRDRDTDVFPSVNKYVINLNQEIKNIYSIELFSASIPNQGSPADEPYLLLQIDEIKETIQSNNKAVSDSFAILPMPANVPVGDNFINLKSNYYENIEKVYYETSKASLNKMSISIKKEDGALFDFGSDTPNAPNKTFQNTFTFRIVILNKSRKMIQAKNLY